MLRDVDHKTDAAAINGKSHDNQSIELPTQDVHQFAPSHHEPITVQTSHDEASLGHSSPSRPRGFWPVLNNRNFLTLWLGQVFSQLADKVYLVLMIAIISSQFEAPGQTISGWVAAVMIAFTIPAVLFGALAGVFVDRWRKQPILVLSNLLRGVLVVLLPLVLWVSLGWGKVAGLPVAFWCLLVITFLISTLTQFFAPAEQAVIPLVVESRNLLSANSLYTTTMMASVILGFAVGEPVLRVADVLLSHLGISHNGPALVVGASYLLAGGCLLFMHPRQEAIDHQALPPHTMAQFWADIREGLAYLHRQTQVRVAIIQLVLLSCVFAALAVLAVRLAELIPALKASQFGFLLAAGGLGMALGALCIGQFGMHVPKRYLSLWGAVGMALCLIALAWTTHSLWFSMVFIALLGVCAALIGIPMQTVIQEKTPEDMRGKVFGLQNNLINIALSLPLALAGAIETALGLSTVFIALGMMVGIGGVISWYIADTALRASQVSLNA
jgi:MFS family permease